jgi:hypothetical protein
MTHMDVEFFGGVDTREPAEARIDDALPPSEAKARWPHWAALAALASWATAAVLAAVAPFNTIYEAHRGGLSASMDGWGRSTGLTAGPRFGEHGIRYGIVLVLCAGVLALLALLAATRIGRPRWMLVLGDGVTTVLAACAAGLLLGVSLATALDVDAMASTFRAANRAVLANAATSGTGAQPAIHLHVGGCVWLSLAAAGCAIAALVAPRWIGRSLAPGAVPTALVRDDPDATDADVLN